MQGEKSDTCKDGSELLHQRNRFLLLPFSMPLVVPGKDKVTAHVGNGGRKQKGKGRHQKEGLPQHKEGEEAVVDSELHIVVWHEVGLVQDHDWPPGCVQVGVLHLLSLVDREGHFGRDAAGPFRKDYLQCREEGRTETALSGSPFLKTGSVVGLQGRLTVCREGHAKQCLLRQAMSHIQLGLCTGTALLMM